MSNLENILAINAAINQQKGNKIDFLPLVEELFKKNSIDLKAIVEDEKNLKSKTIDNLSEQEEKSYNPLKAIIEYLSSVKSKLYDYYSSAKRTTKKLAKSLGYKILTEIEDWGTIYFGTTFKKMIRLTAQGIMARYQQKLWLYVAKK